MTDITMTAYGWPIERRRPSQSVVCRVFGIILALSLFTASQAKARTIHVDAGAGGGTGTQSAPFASIARAVAKARPGDVVLVRAGLYFEQVRVPNSGRANAPITIRGERGAVIDGGRLKGDASLVDIVSNHIVFEGFQVQNAPRTGIALWGTTNVIVRRNVVMKSQGAGIWVGHNRRGASSRNLIESNVVLANCLMNAARKRSSGWPAGIAIAMSDGTRVQGNRVYENHGEGIGVLSSVDVKVSRNTVYDNFSVNIYLDNAPSTRVQANLMGSTGNRKFFRHGRPPEGVLIANEPTAVPMPSRDIAVVSNSMIGTRAPYYGTYGLNTGLSESILEPNLVEPKRWLSPSDVAAGV